MKEIPLTKGMVALVDDEDYEWLSKYNWYAAHNNYYTYYAVRGVRKGGGYRNVRMHREILGLADDSVFVDHIDGNGLNNTRANLRTCNGSQNRVNRNRQKNNKSGYIGVSFNNKDKKWWATIYKDRENIYIGRFDNPVDAAIARDKTALDLHGEFAKLNFPRA